MEALDRALQWLENASFLFVGLWAFARWRRVRTEQSRWLAATFVSLGGVVTVSVLFTDVLGVDPPQALTRLLLIALAAFPYLLLRFLGSFEAVPVLFQRIIALATAVLSVMILLLPSFPEPGDPRPTSFIVFLVTFVAVWVATLPAVGFRFWRAGVGQPTLVRRRLRTLAAAATVLSFTLLLSSLRSGSEVIGPFALVVRALGTVSSVLFVLGFAPPAVVKASWRHNEERSLHEASVGLMRTTSAEEVGALLVPHVRSVVAAEGVALIQGGRLLGAHGVPASADLDALVAGRPIDGTTSYPISDGALYLWPNSYTPFFGQDELELLGRLALLADLALARAALLGTERATRAELAATNEELEAANAELESFVYSASHDLKSPLIAIQSYVELLRDELGELLDDERRWYLERMGTNAAYMESLVGDLLELSRVGRVDVDPEVVDVAALTAEVRDELRERQPGLQVEVGPLPAVWMNPLRCRQLVRNLLENAAAYGGPDVRVWVEARPSSRIDGGVELLVRDDGPGIAPEYREKVFGVFERLAQPDGKSGTGIGLAICRKVVAATGGEIWITDHEGGAEFAILLPPSALAATASSARTSIPSRSTEAAEAEVAP